MVIFSIPPSSNAVSGQVAFARDVERLVRKSTAVPVAVVPHLCHLTDDDPLWDSLTKTQAPCVVVSALYPRAVHWLLRARGIDVGDDGLCVACFRFGDFASANTCADTIAAAAGPTETVEPPSATAQPGESTLPPDKAPPPRWYPVLDYERCIDCGQCHEFCIFGVYAKEGKRVLVHSPDSCKPGCPACARVCPTSAIIFPDYADDAVIAGAAGTAAKGALSMNDILQAGMRANSAVRKPPPAEGTAGVADELDGLIARLEEMEGL